MKDIDATLTVKDIMRIFHVCKITVYRWVSESRAGRGSFPAPLTDTKRKLLWSRTAIEEYLNTKQ